VAARDLRTRLTRRASKASLFLPGDLPDRLLAFYELLSKWNRKMNLTALDDADAAIDRLLLEPVAASRHLPVGAATLMDIGSGGGSPAIPLKLASPYLALTMVEVKARKSAFLREAVRQLELERTTVENKRYEELLVRPELHDAFDVLAVRAVRIEPKALSNLQAFLKPGGVVMMFRGPTGPGTPENLLPPLEFAGTYPLIETLQSRLTLLKKLDSPDSVPRGTW
jgi:16S rRNA (guanine527-N7)-methyltransferase